MKMTKYKSEAMRLDDKLQEEKRKLTVMCKCGRRVSVYRVNNKGWTVCDWCGRKIMRPQDEFKTKLMTAIKVIKS